MIRGLSRNTCKTYSRKRDGALSGFCFSTEVDSQVFEGPEPLIERQCTVILKSPLTLVITLRYHLTD